MDSSDTSFRLQDRTAILTGPCSSFLCAIASKFTQIGANVAFIDTNIERAQRFTEQLMDAREVHERYGRATAIACDFKSAKSTVDAVSRAAEAFGGIDIYVDGMISNHVAKLKEANSLDAFESLIETNLRAPVLMSKSVMKFLESRKRGRLIYLLHDLNRLGLSGNSLGAVTRTGLIHFAKSLAREVRESQATVNCVAMGLTEELLLSQSAESISLQMAQSKIQAEFPMAQLTETERIAHLVAFLASPLGAGITGQTFSVSDGMSFIS